MQGIRNLIQRRRPSIALDPDLVFESAPDGGEAANAQHIKDTQQIELARAGRERVPGPEQVKPKPFLPTMGEPPADSALPAPPAPEPEAEAPVDLTTPSRPQIWDVDPPKAATDRASESPRQSDAERSNILARCAEDPLSPALRDKAASGAGAPPPAQPKPAARNRAKTRLLGFHDNAAQPDVFAAAPASGNAAAPCFPIGWIVVIEGPGRGGSFTLTAGLSTVGRNADQTIALDFGDTAISRENHVAIAFDDEENLAFIGHGGKANIVRLNDRPLLTTEPLRDGDTIRIGKTVLRFVGFCSEDFSWTGGDTDG